MLDPIVLAVLFLQAQAPPPSPPGTGKVLSFDRFEDKTAACAQEKGPPIQQGVRQIPRTQVWVVHPGAVIRTKGPLGACDPAWSPDGRQLAVTAPDGLWVLSGTNWSAAQRLSDAKISDRPANEFDYTAFSKPRWSPDGRRIAYVATNGGATWIEVVDVASGNRMLKTEPGPDSLTWGQDSKSLIVMGRVVQIPH